MLACLYLLVAYWVGQQVFSRFLRPSYEHVRATTLNGNPSPFPDWVVKVPAHFVIGTLLLTWATYLVADCFAARSQPLIMGNVISLGMGTVWMAAQSLRTLLCRRRLLTITTFNRRTWLATNAVELLFVSLTIGVATAVMTYTLHIQNGHTLVVGLSVFSDFGPHLAVMRSFSHGHNFPTEYPHFPDGDMRYHFLFQFLAGNLEFLGLPIDWAFNLPSILAFTACLLLLYALAVLLTGKKSVGLLAALLFFFRSSMAWWEFSRASASPCDTFDRLLTNDVFIGATTHEDWGLWNQNVYLNQRHLAFALALMFLVLIYVFPLFRETVLRLRERSMHKPVVGWWNVFCLHRDAWMPRHGRATLLNAIIVGALLGLAGFWNGAVVIATLLVLFFLSLFSQHRLEYLLIAVVAILMGHLENRLFLGPGQLAIAPQLTLGFLAERPVTMAGIIRYYLELLGLLPFVIVASMLSLRVTVAPFTVALGVFGRPPGSGWWVLVCVTPIVLATTVQFAPDVAINHKYVMIAVMLLNIVAANFVIHLLQHRQLMVKCLGGGILFCLVATGIVDLMTIYNKNVDAKSIKIQLNDPLLLWAKQHTTPESIILSDWYSLHPLLLAGRKIFYGWPYYAWGAGYDVRRREAIVKGIYGGTDQNTVKELIASTPIRYIVIDNGNRQSNLYKLNEELLRSLYKPVYEQDHVLILQVS